MANNKKVIDLLKQALAELGSDDTDQTAEASVDLPGTADEINEMEKADVVALCVSLNISTDGLRLSEIKQLLVTLLNVQTDNDDELDVESVNALATAVSISPSKKMAKTIESLKEYFGQGETAEVDAAESAADTADDEDGEEKAPQKGKKAAKSDDDDDDAEEEDEDEKPANKRAKKNKDEAEEAESDGVDRESIAAESTVPKAAIQTTRLALYNKACSVNRAYKKLAIEEDGEEGYRTLIERMVTSDGEVAVWKTPYIANGEFLCCGLPLVELPAKGDERRGKCAVTGTKFSISEDNTFEPLE